MVRPLPYVDAGIRYAVCEPADVPELTRMLALTFTASDPMPVAVALKPAEFEALVDLVVAPESTRGLTVVARDLESDDLAGALLNEDAATPPPDWLATLSDKYDPIFDLLGQLDAQIAEPPVTEPGRVLHLFLLGVDPQFGGRGIARRLVQASPRRRTAPPSTSSARPGSRSVPRPPTLTTDVTASRSSTPSASTEGRRRWCASWNGRSASRLRLGHRGSEFGPVAASRTRGALYGDVFRPNHPHPRVVRT